MALYRTVSVGFWTDGKVADDFTPEDRYFYLYLFTNPHTNLCGCYEISIKQIVNEIGYSSDSVGNLVKRFEAVHKVIRYSKETKEILLLNWHKYNWTKSEKFLKAIEKEILKIKNSDFQSYLFDVLNGIYRVSIPYTYPIDTTNTNSSTDASTNVSNAAEYPYKAIVDYLNQKAGTAFKDQSKDTRRHIKARIDEGFTLDDFKKVIDGRVAEWKADPRMCQYIRPQTLFGTKFESYLNAKPTKPKREHGVNFTGREYDFDSLEKQLLNAQRGVAS